MLARHGALPSGDEWAYELKIDGFRAIASTYGELTVQSRRGWNMAELLPELAGLTSNIVVDGEVVAWRDGRPDLQLTRARLMNRNRNVPVTFVVFDLLHEDGDALLQEPFEVRRRRLERLGLAGTHWATSDVYNDGEALFRAVCKQKLEGVVAKRWDSIYLPGVRGWVKTKNPRYPHPSERRRDA